MEMNELKNELKELARRASTPLWSTEGKPKVILAEVFHSTSGWAWDIYEIEECSDGEIAMFGRVHGFESEMGYFYSSQFETLSQENLYLTLYPWNLPREASTN